MNLEYISHKELGCTPDYINQQIQWLQEEENWKQINAWWTKHEMPEGLQCVALHGYMNLRQYVDDLLKERKQSLKDKALRVRCALMIDSMIH